MFDEMLYHDLKNVFIFKMLKFAVLKVSKVVDKKFVTLVETGVVYEDGHFQEEVDRVMTFLDTEGYNRYVSYIDGDISSEWVVDEKAHVILTNQNKVKVDLREFAFPILSCDESVIPYVGVILPQVADLIDERLSYVTTNLITGQPMLFNSKLKLEEVRFAKRHGSFTIEDDDKVTDVGPDEILIEMDRMMLKTKGGALCMEYGESEEFVEQAVLVEFPALYSAIKGPVFSISKSSYYYLGQLYKVEGDHLVVNEVRPLYKIEDGMIKSIIYVETREQLSKGYSNGIFSSDAAGNFFLLDGLRFKTQPLWKDFNTDEYPLVTLESNKHLVTVVRRNKGGEGGPVMVLTTSGNRLARERVHPLPEKKALDTVEEEEEVEVPDL